jgi:ubiquinone/menaquinone biosynthesis C-methylase UbiE
MRKIGNNSLLNSPEEYYRKFIERRGEPDWMDIKRWKALVAGFKGGRLVDLGCLDSMVPFIAKEKYPKSEVWGFDQAEKVIEVLAEEYPQINYTSGDVYDTMFPSGYFDYIVAGELIEHLEKPELFFKEAFRILKSGGKLAISIPKEETEAGEVDGKRHLWSFSASDIRDFSRPYMRGAQIKILPNWIGRRIKYHHPYLICLVTKK